MGEFENLHDRFNYNSMADGERHERQMAELRAKLAQAQTENADLKALLAELRKLFHAYEMDVDDTL